MPEAAPAAQAPQTQQQLPLRPTARFELPADPPAAPAPEQAPAPAPQAPAEDSKLDQDAQNKGDEAPPAEPEAKPDEEDTPERAAKRQARRFERRLDKLYRERGELQARADAAERRLAELQQPKAPQGEPKLEDFDFDPAKYGQAMVEWGKTQAARDFETKQRTESARTYAQRLTSQWEERVTEAEDRFKDFHEVVGEIQPTSAFAAAIMSADPAVAYHFGKHPKEAEELASKTPIEQAYAIGKLEAKLLAKPVEPRTPSKAPAPISPVSGNMAAPPPDSLENPEMQMEEWIKRRNKQINRRR